MNKSSMKKMLGGLTVASAVFALSIFAAGL